MYTEKLQDENNRSDEWVARSNFYLLISSLFAEPGSERFRMLSDVSFRSRLITAAEKYPGGHAPGIRRIFSLVDGAGKNIADEYIRVFGHTLSKETSPYELERGGDEVFRKTQELADINAFYTAFGLEMKEKERPDHLSVESEFIAFLLLKEAVAVENHLDDDARGVCTDARCNFWKDHYSPWIFGFLDSLERYAPQSSYASFAAPVREFLNDEKHLCLMPQASGI